MRKPSRLVALTVLLAAGLAGWFAQRAPAQEKEKPPPAVQKWEYKQIEKGIGDKPKDIEGEFNKLGGDGWELVTAYQYQADGGVTRFVFKRPKR